MELNLREFDYRHAYERRRDLLIPGGASGAGGSGRDTNGSPTVYTPTAQPAADQSFQDIIASLIGISADGGAGTPAGTNYPIAQDVVSNYLTESPYLSGGLDAAQAASAYGTDTLFPAASAGAAGLNAASLGGLPYANQMLDTGFDPQGALRNRSVGRLVDNSNATNAMAGIAGTPYGASVTSSALNNFDLDWQDRQLARQGSAATGYGNILGASGKGIGQAQEIGDQGATDMARLGALPYGLGATAGKDQLKGLTDLTTLGNNQYALPQTTLELLLNYLGYGTSASKASSSIGKVSDDLTAAGISGALSGANSLFGSNSLLGGSSGIFGSGGLFGGSGGSSDYGTDYGGGGDFSVGDGLKTVGTIASLASLFSDRRMKTDIQRRGTLDNGLPVYQFRYHGSPKTQIGLMADEVEQLHPEAVSEHGVAGLKMVDYNRAVR